MRASNTPGGMMRRPFSHSIVLVLLLATNFGDSRLLCCWHCWKAAKSPRDLAFSPLLMPADTRRSRRPLSRGLGSSAANVL